MRKQSVDTYLKTAGAVTMAALVLIGAGCAGNAPVVTESTVQEVAEGESPFEPVATPTDKPAVVSNVYKNGTYTAVGNYNSPAGSEEIKVTITLKEDIITDATVVAMATNPKSVFMQGRFIEGYKTLVIGKKIDEVQLTVVSGSSLTPKGFIEALAEIKAQAKV
ncbi:MAG: hypothetical protein WC813_01575 [Patescibacteria group bacterium]|jgi:uncharacterized protein with FMN-binding domain